MKVENVLVLGGAGFIGRHLAAELARRVIKVTVPSRRRERAKPVIQLPTVEVLEADVTAPGVLQRLAAGRDAVINLIGILHSRRGRRDERGPHDYGPDFARLHVELPQAVVAACRAVGVKRLLHMSALGAAPQAPSEYLRSKAIGEQAVLAADDLEVTAFRPSIVFGPDDSFINMFAALSRFLPALLVACPRARFQPVYVGDVAHAIVSAIDEPRSHGKAYDLCGPRVYTLRELVEFVCAITRRRRLIIPLSDRMSYLLARLMELAPHPLMTRDNYRSMQVPSVCGADCTLPFGLIAQALEAVVPFYLAPGPARALSAVSLAREALVPSAGKRVGGERGEPVLAGVAAARELCEAGSKVALTCFAQKWPVGQGARKAEIAPRAAEVQPIEMRELSVVAVADSRRLEQRGRQFEQEGVEPAAKIRQHAAHEIGLDEAGREKIVAAGLPGGRIAAVVAEIVDGSLDQQRLERGVGVIQRKGEAEGGVGVSARTDRVGLPGKPLLVGLHYHFLQGLQVSAFLRQLERPCPAIGALELRVPPEVFGLDLEIGGA